MFIYRYKRKFSRIFEILFYTYNARMFAIFFIARNNGSVSSPLSQQMLSSFSLFNVFIMLPKNELKVSAIFALSVETFPPSSSVILLFLDPFFSVKSGDFF